MGVYTRTFELDSQWAKRRTYIVFEGVSSHIELYINDKFVGISSGSHLPAEFELTEYVCEGVNTITAKVRKWCAGSYLEDQDFFRLSGIFRDVYLLSRDTDHLHDIEIYADDKAITEEQIVDKIALKEMLSKLDGKKRQVIMFRFFNEMTQEQVAKILGISQVQVCRIEKKVLKELKNMYISST